MANHDPFGSCSFNHILDLLHQNYHGKQYQLQFNLFSMQKAKKKKIISCFHANVLARNSRKYDYYQVGKQGNMITIK